MATVNYSWTLPTVGASVNTWGTLLNTIIDDIDAKMVSKTATQTLTNKTLTAPTFTGGITVSSGGASITGNTSVAGTLGVSAETSVAGALVSTSANLAHQANAVKLSYEGSSLSQLSAYGANTTTQGSISVVAKSSNGSLSTVVGTFSSTGLAVTGSVSATGASSNDQLILERTGGATGKWGIYTHSNSLFFSDNVASDERMVIDASGNLLVGATSGSYNRLVKSNNANYVASVENTNSTNGYCLRLSSASAAGSTWNLVDGFANSVAVFRVSGNGNVTNYNNSYGSISSKEYKVNIVDTTPKLAKLLKYRVVNYSLKDDPDQLKQIGLIWEELYEISPGLCEETPEFADVEIEPARTEIKVTQRQKTRTEESTRYEVLLVDGQWTKLPVRTEVQVPLFDLHPLFEQDGSPVMEVAEPAIEASPALYDKDGNEVTPAVEAKPAVMRQVMFQVPAMEDVEEIVEIPAKTESRPTGKTIKSVKYSVLVPMLVKAMQEQQAQIEELKAKVGA